MRSPKKLLGWEPKTSFRDGLKKTMDWYFATKQREEVRGVLDKMLTRAIARMLNDDSHRI